LSQPTYCHQCGAPLAPNSKFCSKCSAPVAPVEEGVPYAPPAPVQTAPQPRPGWSSSQFFKLIVVIILIFVILVVPVIPRDKVIYVDGSTQTVTTSTAYMTSLETYSTQTEASIKVYKGNLRYVADQYYNYYYEYNYYSNCYYDPYSGYIYCPDYNYWPNYSSYTYTVTVDPSDNVVKIERTQESNGLWTLTLAHYDGTSDTYRHVFSEDLTQSGVSTVQGVAVLTNTMTSTVLNPQTITVPCQNCIPQHITVYVSILQLIFGA
jgi:hypothetical protein